MRFQKAQISFFPLPIIRKILAEEKLNILFIVLGYFFLLIYSVLFYKERVLYSDTAYYLFQLVNQSTFHFEHHRYGAFLSQILPLIGIIVGLPLTVVGILYSISIPLLSVIWSLVIYIKRKSKSIPYISILFLLQILTVRHLWFWPVSELLLGLLVLIVAFYYFNEKKYILSAFIFILAFFCHPSVSPVCIAILVANLTSLNYKETLLFMCIGIIIFLVIPRSAYEENKMEAFTNLNNITNSPFWIYLKNSSVKIYVLLFPVVFITLYSVKKPLFVFISIAFTLFWLLLISASENTGTSAVLYENSMLPIVSFWLICATQVNIKTTIKSTYILLTIFIFSGYLLFLEYTVYRPNITLKTHTIKLLQSNQPGYDTFVIQDKNMLFANDKIMENRAPVEYLLQSSIELKGKPVFVIPATYAEDTSPNNEDVYLGNDLPILKREELNPAYFIADTTKIKKTYYW